MIATVIAITLLHGSGTQSLEVRLGQERATFGNRAKGKVDEYIFDTGEVIPTSVLYPVGTSQRRYLFGQQPPAPQGKFFLTFQSKTNGVSRTDWRIALVPSTGSTRGGALETYMAARGWMIPRNAAKTIRKSVEARRPFAAYKYLPWGATINYGFIADDGAEANWSSFDLAKPDGSFEGPVREYPITKLESALIAKG